MSDDGTDLLAVKALRKAGIEELVAERQEASAEEKEARARKDKLSAKIMGLMLKYGADKVVVGQYPVALVTDAKSTRFDKDGFIRFLTEHKVPVKLIADGLKKFTEVTEKKPYIRVGGGAPDSE